MSDDISENAADTGVCSGPEENDWGTPTGSVGAQGSAVCANATASREATAVFVHDIVAGEGTPEGRSEELPINPFTIVEEPLHALSWER